MSASTNSSVGRQTHHAELRVQGGERVVGDLRSRGGGRGQRKVDLPAFGSPTSPASAISLSRSHTQRSSPRPALVRPARRAVGGGFVVRVAEPAVAAAAASVIRLPGRSRSASRVSRSSARIWVPIGTLMTRSGAPAPVRSAPAPLPPFLARKCWRVAEVDQGVEVGHRLEHDVAALAAVAAVRAAELDEFLAPERDHAVAAVTGAAGRSWPGRGISWSGVRGGRARGARRRDAAPVGGDREPGRACPVGRRARQSPGWQTAGPANERGPAWRRPPS